MEKKTKFYIALFIGLVVSIIVIVVIATTVNDNSEYVAEETPEQKTTIDENQNRISESYDVSEGFSNYIREGFREGARSRRGRSSSRRRKSGRRTRRKEDLASNTANTTPTIQAPIRSRPMPEFNGKYMKAPHKLCTWNTCQKLVNYHIMGSFNSCAKTNIPSSCTSTVVSKEELTKVLLTGFRFIDFEIYSIKGKIVVGIGGARYQYTKCPTDSGNEALLKPLRDNGTYGITDHPKYPFIPIKEALETVKSVGFGQAGNKNDPLFILFRIKSFDSKIYIALETAIKNVLGQHLLPKSYGRDGALLGNNRPITKLPLYALKRKAIICVEDHCKLYEQPEAKGCFDLINMRAGGIYLKTYKYQEILDANRDELRREAYSRIIIGYPDYETDDSLKQSWATMHSKGIQVAMVRYRTIVCDKNQNFVLDLLGNNELNTNGYIDNFASQGAFKIKDKSMLPKPDTISKDIQSRTSPKEKLTANTEHTDALGNKQIIKGAGK